MVSKTISRLAFRVGLASACGLGMCVAQAADFTVNDLTDAVDFNPGDGICEVTLATGDCTLRAAIMEANALAGPDTITLQAEDYVLTLAGVDERCDGDTPCSGTGAEGDPYLPVITVDASVGDLDITDDLTITGADIEETAIGWGDPANWGTLPAADTDPLTGDRIFHVQTDGANITSVVIQDLAVVNGEVGLVPTDATSLADPGPNAYDIEVVNGEPGSVEIWQFRRMGGAIALGAGYAVVLYEETVHGPGGDMGGGMGGGGGSDVGGPFPGGKPGEEEGFSIDEVTLNRVAIVSSWAGADGGGLYSAVPATVNQTAVSGNFSGANGGGIYNDAVMTLTESLVGRVFDPASVAQFPDLANGNEGENGGGLFDTGSHTTTISHAAINGNVAIGGGGIAGRAGVTIDMDNSTVSDNTASDVAGGINTNGTVNLQSVTVANNTADTDAPGGGAGLNSFGPGVFNFNSTLLQNNLKNLAAPVLTNCGCSGGGACAAGVMVSGGFNLEDGDSCDMDPAVLMDQTGTDALLGDLLDNGGLTETRALGANSPAIDAGDEAGACQTSATDQRGVAFPRSTDGNGDRVDACDIGAFEALAAIIGGGGGGGGGCSVAGAPRGFDPMFLLFLAVAGVYWIARRRYLTGRSI